MNKIGIVDKLAGLGFALSDLTLGDFDVIDDESMQFTLPGIRESDEDAVYFPMDFSKPVEMTEIHAVMEALQRAVNHPYIDTHVFDFLAYRLEQLPDRHSLYDYLLQLDAALFPLNPTLGLNRKLTRYVCAAAVQVARQGKTDTAIALLDCITLYHQKLAASSHDRIGLLVAYNCKVMAHVTRVFVYQMASDTSASQKAMADFNEALRIKPDYALAYADRANAHMVMGDKKSALAHPHPHTPQYPTSLYPRIGELPNHPCWGGGRAGCLDGKRSRLWRAQNDGGSGKALIRPSAYYALNCGHGAD